MDRERLDYDAVIKENASLKRQVEELKREAALKNARGAGRKAQNREWMERYEAVMRSITEGVGYREAMERLGISKTTYYRFRRLCLTEVPPLQHTPHTGMAGKDTEQEDSGKSREGQLDR